MGLTNGYEAKLMDYFTYFELKDLLGFAKICKVDKEIVKKALLSAAMNGENAIRSPEWEELIVTTVENFSNLGRKERREIIKLAKEIKLNNIDEKNRVKDQDTSPQE